MIILGYIQSVDYTSAFCLLKWRSKSFFWFFSSAFLDRQVQLLAITTVTAFIQRIVVKTAYVGKRATIVCTIFSAVLESVAAQMATAGRDVRTVFVNVNLFRAVVPTVSVDKGAIIASMMPSAEQESVATHTATVRRLVICITMEQSLQASS